MPSPGRPFRRGRPPPFRFWKLPEEARPPPCRPRRASAPPGRSLFVCGGRRPSSSPSRLSLSALIPPNHPNLKTLNPHCALPHRVRCPTGRCALWGRRPSPSHSREEPHSGNDHTTGRRLANQEKLQRSEKSCAANKGYPAEKGPRDEENPRHATERAPHNKKTRHNRKGRPNLGGPVLHLSMFLSGGVLLSHTVPGAVPSALEGLTTGFGMRPGVSPPL